MKIVKPVILFFICLSCVTVKAEKILPFLGEKKMDIGSVVIDTLSQFSEDDLSFQESSTAKIHSPKRATYYSMALPGLGQVYNKKYWKLPIVYSGLGGLTYYTLHNRTQYKNFLSAYRYVVNGDTGDPPNHLVELYGGDRESLRRQKDNYLRNTEVSYILIGAFYILQVLDATVDAYFYDFDVSSDLSLRIEPRTIFLPKVIPGGAPCVGLSVMLIF